MIIIEALLTNKITKVEYTGNKDVDIDYDTDELIALCPETGNPDFYKLKITFIPNKYMPELYSFKKYLYNYMKIKIFQENLASQIYNDFMKIIKPYSLKLELSERNPFGLSPTVRL